MFNHKENIDFKGSALGLFTLSFKGITRGQATFLFVGNLVLNIVLLLVFGWAAQIFWAWFVPGVLPMLPASISYWHAFAVVCLAYLFMPRNKK